MFLSDKTNSPSVIWLIVLLAAIYFVFCKLQKAHYLGWKKASVFSLKRVCKAADLGDPEAQWTAATYLLTELLKKEKTQDTSGQTQNIEAYLLKAADQKFIPAHETLAYFYMEDRIEKVDYEKAWYHEAINYLKSSSKDTEKNLEKLKTVEKLAMKKESDFQVPTQKIAEYINSTSIDDDEHKRCANLISDYLKNRLLDSICPPEKALESQHTFAKIFQQIAEAISIIENNGEMPPDVENSQIPDSNLIVLAENDDSKAQNKLGNFYRDCGDQVRAFYWWHKSAQRGCIEAISQMHSSYYFFTDNKKEAVKWASIGAEKGSPELQYFLAQAYKDGEGIPRNYVLAYKWYSLAAAQGNKSAEKELNNLETIISPQQVYEGQKLAQE